MVTVYRYQQDKKTEWDSFVANSRTPLFFFQRDFIEYHGDRFADNSLMFYQEETLVAVLPASKNEKTLLSHGGLTYGGLICPAKIRAETVIHCVKSLVDFAAAQGFKKIIYKATPYIFYAQPAQDDLYALTNVAQAALVRRDLSSIIFLKQRLALSKGRKWLIARAKKNNLVVTNSTDWDSFHSLLTCVLDKHDAKPVHSVEELQRLSRLFAQNIVLKVVVHEGQLLAASVLFIFSNVTHTQYMAVSDAGKELGALDYLIETCVHESMVQGFDYFSFGVSTEQDGRFLNSGLLTQKESFGARALCLDFYEIDLNEY